ncbi:1-(5-phosphoribosyl)-5-[(5-phosphoribosylamino)methylideneamino]imidazole-4-carboxamide isomerase [Peptococcaceae bacterium]|nr:1-(5-phosphoribosyl)-5-[(5-phosphoribosylamino)methylideneamino]imidazole-4-carboxamide isomerase [Peptococcaceae bacterium]
MIIFPAIDLKDGKCVRLVEGKLDKKTIYSDKPEEAALHWQSLGAEFLHIIDLDGAFKGAPKNLSVIEKILAAIKIPVQIGGGIRTLDTVKLLLDLGIKRVILGTAAVSEPNLVKEAIEKFGSDRIVLGIDARNGCVAVKGWAEESDIDAKELALNMKKIGIERIVFTDIKRDGTLKGPNIEATKEMALATGLKVIASGGVSSIDDLKELKEIEQYGVEGVIVGQALYKGAIDLKEALQCLS